MEEPIPRPSAAREWITGKALPLAFWGLFLISVAGRIPEWVLRLVREGWSLTPALELVRHCLTLAFIALVGSTYLTRMRAVGRARGASEILFPMFVFLAGIAGVAVLVLHRIPPRPAQVLSGLLLACLGICMSLWALTHLRNSFSILAEARRVVTSGPYRYVRHPLYLGEAATMLGLCLTIGTVAAILFWAVINGLQLARARVEERKLEQEFPEYRLYRERTCFILPGLY
jgi:protein-S-isoprenylcysteine O-methyltransferase Ste14